MPESHSKPSANAYKPSPTPRVVPGSNVAPSNSTKTAYTLSASTSLKAVAAKASSNSAAKK